MNRLYFFLIFGATTLFAQDGNYSLGARSAALSGSSLTHTDAWSVANNVGSMGATTQNAVAVTYQNRYSISELQVIGGSLIHQIKPFTLGFKYFKFGDRLFNQQLIGAAIGNRFQMVSLGLGFNFVQTMTESLRTKRVLVIEFGGRAEITPNLFFGAHIFNLKNQLDHPTVMRTGLSYTPTGSLLLSTQVEKQLNLPESYHLSIEYQVIPTLFIRTGMELQGSVINRPTISNSFGFGLKAKQFVVDYAYLTEGDLGGIHELSVTYQLSK